MTKRTHDSRTAPSISCDQCGTPFASKYALKLHKERAHAHVTFGGGIRASNKHHYVNGRRVS